MADQPPHLILTIETKDPIEVGNFAGQLTSLASQYEKYIRQVHPDLADEAEVFVAEVKEGSIVAHLIPHFLMTPTGILGAAALAGTTAWAVMEVIENYS